MLTASVGSHNAVCSDSTTLAKLVQAGTFAGGAAVSAAAIGIGAYEIGKPFVNNCSHPTTTIFALLGLGATLHRAARFASKPNSFSEQIYENPHISNACLLVAGGVIAKYAVGACLNLSEEARQPLPFWTTVAIGTGVICWGEHILKSLK